MHARRRAILESETIGLFSRWVDDSQVRVRVRTIGKGEKIIVDLFVLTPHESTEVPRTKLNRIATNSAIVHGAASADYCVIYDYDTARKSTRLDGSITATDIRDMSYVFQGVV